MKRMKNYLCLLIIMMGVLGVCAQETNYLYPKVKRLEGQGNGGNWLNLTEATRNAIMAGVPWKVQEPEYEQGASPVVVRVTNPTMLQPYEYRLRIIPVSNNLDNSLLDSAAHWELKWYDTEGVLAGQYLSQSSIGEGNEEIILGHGIAITVKNHPFSIHDKNLARYVNDHGGRTYQNNSWYTQPDLIGSQVTYEGAVQWLDGLKDAETTTPDNWIRAGHYRSTSRWECNSVQPNMAECDYTKWRTEDFFNLYNSENGIGITSRSRGFMDFYGQFENIAQGTWAPYMLSSPYDGGPKARYLTKDAIFGYSEPVPSYYNFTSLQSVPNMAAYNQTLTNLYSVDIVLTPDTALWTRALVLESGSGTEADGIYNYCVYQHFNGHTYYNRRHEPKACPSVDKNGNPDNSGTTGFGWFPGYAINVETGERLNIMFAENSEDEYNHGNDMIFNPTNVYAFQKDNEGNYILDNTGNPIPMTQEEYNTLYSSSVCNHEALGEPLYGGRHYVYICASSGNTANIYYRNNNRQRSYNDDDLLVSVSGSYHGGTFTGTDGVSYPYYECGVYDKGKWLSEKFKTVNAVSNYSSNARKAKKMQIFNNVMWTGIPMPAEGLESEWLANDATISIRVSRPYMFYSSAVGTGPDNPTNSNAPLFSFTTLDLDVAQSHNLYNMPEKFDYEGRININNIDAPVSPHGGSWFFNSDYNEADYCVPKGSDKRSIFGYSFWMGGKDGQDSLHIFAERFNQGGYDTWPGPLSLIDASIDEETMLKWNRTFKITRKEVLEFMTCRQNPEYSIPQHILDWPAHGDTAKGQAWLLAPFIDIDGDNYYDPTQGDYPDFPGDMAQFVIFNDNYAQHGESQGAPMGVEVHVMVYAFDAPEDSIMNNALFLRYKIFNRSQNNYHQTYIGLWNDWDLGYGYDDYVGCDVMKNTAYCYNGSEIDGTGQYWAYDSLWPVQTLTLLSGPLMPADGQDNPAYTNSSDCSTFMNNGLNEYGINGTDGFGDGIVDNERYGLTGFVYHNNDHSVTGDPQNATEYYNLMRGIWRDGSHVKYGGNGHSSNGGNGPECNFMFPALTDNCNLGTHGVDPNPSQYGTEGWTEANVGNPPYDRRGLASVGPFNLGAGEMQELELSLVTIPHSYAVTSDGITLDSLYRVNPQYPTNNIPTIAINIYETICEGDSLNFFGTLYSETGLFSHFVPNLFNSNEIADTIYYLHLTVTPTYTVHEISACDSLIWYNSTYTTTTDFIQTFTTENGCDSLVFLRLKINNSMHNVESIVDCNFYTWHGQTYYESGTYIYEYTDVKGCPAADTLHLTVPQYDTTIVNDTVYVGNYFVSGYKYSYQYKMTPDKYTQWADSVSAASNYPVTCSYDSITNMASKNYIRIYDYRSLPGNSYYSRTLYPDYNTWNNLGYYDFSDTLTGLSSHGCDTTVIWNTRIYWGDLVYLYGLEECSYIFQGDSISLNGTTATGTATLWLFSGDTLTESGTYYQYLTNTNGCDSSVVQYLTIHPAIYELISESACENYAWNGVTYTESGDYKFNTDTTVAIIRNLFWRNSNWGYWNSLGFFTTYRPTGWSNVYTHYNYDNNWNVTSIDYYFYDGHGDTIHLESSNQVVQYADTVDACKETTLHLIINHSVTNSFEATACDSYTWNDSTYTTSGEYVQTFTAANGCDSTVTLQLIINESKHTDTTAESCGSYTWNETTYITTGEYTQTFTGANGCDSTVTLYLTIYYANTGDTTAVANDRFDWYEHTYLTMSGDYTHVFTNQNGCDSTVTLHLTINNPTISVQDTVITAGYFVWHGMVLTSDTVLTEIIPVLDGYDSLIVYHIFVTPTPLTVLTIDTCVSYTLNGQTYAESGDYVQTFPISSGIDSVVVLYLTIFTADSAEFAETTCEFFTWEGTTYTTSGDYMKTFTNANGCDSTVTLHLTIFPADSADFAETACGSFEWNGETFTISGDYTRTLTNTNGCDSVVTLHLTIYTAEASEFSITTPDSCYTWNSQSYCASGDYSQTLQTVHGCDSVVTLHLTITVGIDDYNLGASMTVYPNPTTGVVNVECTMNNGQAGEVEFQLFDAFGRLLRSTDGVETRCTTSLQTDTHGSSVQTAQIDLSRFAAGVYFVKAVADGNVVAVRKVVKR